MKDTVLIFDKDLGRYRMTRLQARKRYLHTIKPWNDLLDWLDSGDEEYGKE